MCGSEALSPPVGDVLAAYATTPAKAKAQIAYCVRATSETPISLPIRSVNERTDEKRSSEMRVSFSSMTAARIVCPYMMSVR